jgi:hypothetical protein
MKPPHRFVIALSFAMLASCEKRESVSGSPPPPPSVHVASPGPLPSASTPAPATGTPTGERVDVEGAGASIVAPPGVEQLEVGTALVDESGELSIVFVVNPLSTHEQRERRLALGYPGAEEVVRIGGRQATLRHRTRSLHQTGDDGWLLTVRGDPALTVIAGYQGEDPERWRSLRAHLLTIEWDPGSIDPEIAFGMTPGKVAGMRLEKNHVGGLLYRAEPPDAESVELAFLTFPVVLPEGPEACFEILRGSSIRQAKVGTPSAMKTTDGLAGCELTGEADDEMATYWSGLRADGGFIVAIGKAPKATFASWHPRFAAAVRALRPIPTPE